MTSKRLRELAAAALVCLNTALVQADDGAHSHLAVAAVEPHTLFEGEAIAGCGFRARIEHAGNLVSFDLTVFRAGQETEFALSPVWQGAGETEKPLAGIRLQTVSHDSEALFPPLARTSNGRHETRAKLDNFEGASFVQELMVEGATVAITAAAGDRIEFALPRPMPQNVRASYLNCAGDLFRPAEP